LTTTARNCVSGLNQFLLGLLLAALLLAAPARPDEPFARSRDYDLLHSKIVLKFDVQQKKVIGDVTHSLSLLKNTNRLSFDSVGLTIQSVLLNKSAAKFETKDDKLIVPLAAAAKPGDKFEVEIRYEGKTSKGAYFILPDKDYPDRPKQIWTQGESEDTRYYLPTYDYPNDRLTTETILTVPATWITVATTESKCPAMVRGTGGSGRSRTVTSVTTPSVPSAPTTNPTRS